MSIEQECDREWDDRVSCSGPLVHRTTSGGFSQMICVGHRDALEDNLAQIAERYPEINHPDGCSCWGCSDGSY